MFRGVRLHLLGQAAIFATTLFVTPRLVHGLNTEGYAVYTLIWTLINYIALLSLGSGAATQRYTALFAGKNEPARLASLLRSVLYFQVAVSGLGALINYALHGWIAEHVLNMEPVLAATAGTVFAALSLAVPFFFILRFALDVLYGQQRFGLYNLLNSLQMLSVAIAAAVLVGAGRGLREIITVFIILHGALAAAALLLVRRALWPGKSAGRPSDVREFAAFSLKGFLSQILWMITFQGDRVFIGALLPIRQMGFYAIASGIAQKLNVLCGAVSSTVYPIFTELHGKGEEVRLRRLYLKATQLNLYLLIPLSILTFVLAPQFLTLWLGEEFSRTATWPLRLLVLGNFAYVGDYLPNNVASGKGAPQLFGFMRLGKVVVLIVLWLFAIPRWGILGAAGGLAAAEWLGTPLFLTYIHRRFLALGWWEYLKEGCWRPVAAGLAATALGLVTHARVGTWAELRLDGTLSAAAYLAAGYVMLDQDAKQLLSDFKKRYI
ncbi:MAG: oligosaccharide flippase family protein [Elusimicrobiota bacterium]